MDLADHLVAPDGATLLQACELWTLWQDSVKLAASDPLDRANVSAVCRYSEQYRNCLKLLCLDPLGRLKAARSQKRTTSKAMKFFA